MSRTVLRIAGVVALLHLAGCAGFKSLLLSPQKEGPVQKEETYIDQAGGPQTQVDLGEGSEQLLTRFQSLLEERDEYRARQDELIEEVEALRTSLRTEQEDRDKERRLRAGVEAENERLRRIKGERELKILHLQMQVSELQRSKLLLEIAGIERQIEALDDSSHQMATPEPLR